MSDERLGPETLAALLEVETIECEECGKEVDSDAVVFLRETPPHWARCAACVSSFAQSGRRIKVDPARVAALIEAGEPLPDCGECGGPAVRPGERGLPRLAVNGHGEIVGSYCAACVRRYAERKAVETAKAEILGHLAHHARSKGWCFKTLMRNGRRLDVLREAVAELVADGEISDERGLLDLPSRTPKPKALRLVG